MKALLVADAGRDMLLEQVLLSRGHGVQRNTTADEAVDTQRREQCPLVFVDISSAAAHTPDLLSSLTHESADSVVVALVDGDRSEDLKDAVSAGVADWMPKPLSRDGLDARIALLERTAQRLSEGRRLRDRLEATERERARLERSEQSFHALVDASPDPIAVHRQGIIQYVNPAAIAAFGFPSLEAAVGRRVLDMVHLDDRGEVAVRIQSVMVTGRPAPLREERFLSWDGHVLVGEAYSFPVHYDGKVSVMTVGRDLTERRELESQLLHCERLASIGRMTAGIAHELKNPLTYILCNLADLCDRLPPLGDGLPDEAVTGLKDRVTSALEGAERLRDITQDLSQFARLQDEPDAVVDVTEAARGALRMAAGELGDVEVETDFGATPIVRGSELRLGQVFLNLLINAADAVHESPPPRIVALRTGTDADGWAFVEVRDSGVGITPSAIPRVFDAFYTTKPVGKGTGLGLAVAHAIVTRFGGEIAIDSRRDAGTLFRVRFPPLAPPTR